MPLQVKLLLLVLFAGMVGIGIYVVDNAVTGPEQASLSRPSYVERLIPQSGSNVLSQATVGVDLAAGYDAYLVINGTRIDNEATEDDTDGLRKAPTLGLVEYDPAPGHRIEELSSPKQCVDAWVWKTTDGRDSAIQLSWCFEVT